MPSVVALAVGGVVAGSVYYLLKQMNNSLADLDKDNETILIIKDNIKHKRYVASKLKQQLKVAHDHAFNTWVNLKASAQKISRAVDQVIQAIKSGAYRGKQLKNLKATRKKLIAEQKKATFIKRQAHSKWDKLRDDYLSAKRQLNALY